MVSYLYVVIVFVVYLFVLFCFSKKVHTRGFSSCNYLLTQLKYAGSNFVTSSLFFFSVCVKTKTTTKPNKQNSLYKKVLCLTSLNSELNLNLWNQTMRLFLVCMILKPRRSVIYTSGSPDPQWDIKAIIQQVVNNK